MDVEWAHAIAPGATIILSVAKSNSYADLLGAVDAAVANGATVVSMSWGGTESSAGPGYDAHFVSGVTFVASSGDSGELTRGPQVEWPASSPNVVGVGGTSLYLDASGNRVSAETAWADSGGGLSSFYVTPPWQTAWQSYGTRGVPDVSFVADPNTGVYVVYGRYLYQVGGTSVGAPQWAALVALANQGGTTLGSGANAAIYKLAANPTPPPTINPTYFLDIISGNNGSHQDDYAVAGYDLVTGLGSPWANTLVPALP